MDNVVVRTEGGRRDGTTQAVAAAQKAVAAGREAVAQGALGVGKESRSFVQRLALALLRMGYALGSWVVPIVAAHHAAKFLCTPRRSSRRRAKAAGLGGAVRDYLWVDGRRVAIYRWGNPTVEPYVLLVHGWSSFALRFLPWVEALRAHGYAVVGFDQPGHGYSEGRRCNLPAIVRSLNAVAAMHGPAAAVLAHSLGGTATMLALSEGLRAARVILFAPVADVIAAVERFARKVALSPRVFPELIRMLEADAHTSATNIQMHLRVPFLRMPALIMHDLGDREVPWGEGERYARYWPDARLLTMAGLGHRNIVNEPMVIAEGLRFLHGETIGTRVVSSRNPSCGST